MTILPKANHGFNPMPMKMPMSFFIDIKKKPKIYMEGQKTKTSLTNPEQQ